MGRQRLGDHLAGGVDPHMQFAPRPPFGPAVLTDFPLALAIDLQAGRIHHQVHRAIRAIGLLFRQHHRQRPLTTRQGRVVRRRQELHQERLDKALRLAQRQPKQHPHRQHPFNRWIRIDKRSTPLRRPLIIPLLESSSQIVRLPRATNARLYDDQFLTRYTASRLDRGRTAR